jgi:hypothetical protein
MTQSQQKARSKGLTCFLWGCLAAVGVAVLGVIVVIFGANFAVDKLVDTYTDTEAVELPPSEISDESYNDLLARIAAFQQTTDPEGEPAADPGASSLALTGDEINALVARNEGFAALQDKVHLTIEGDEITGEISLPLDELPPLPYLADKIEGRYLNGKGSFNIDLSNGRLSIFLNEFEVKGQPLPPEVMQSLRQQNWAQDAAKDPKFREALEQFEKIEIRDGQLIIQAK